MQIEIRLKDLLQAHGLDERGVVQRIATELRMHRHTVGKLYHNRATHPSLEALGKICDWLQNHGVSGHALPQALIGQRPSKLWQAVAAPGAATLYVGEYRQMPAGPRPRRWIAQQDALAMAKIVQSLSSATDIAERRVPVRIEYVPFRFDPEKPSVSKVHLSEDKGRAGEIYKNMRATGRVKSSIILGSQRANHLVELLVADTFGCDAFVRPKKTAGPVPFYLVFRKDDRVIPSCFGGRTVPRGCKQSSVPGVYYLSRHGWSVCPWKQDKQDAGVVVVVRDKGTAALDLALFGFSGPGTEALAEQLLQGPDRFWPPRVETNGKQIGVHVCRFALASVASTGRETEVCAKDVDVIPLDEKILEERVA